MELSQATASGESSAATLNASWRMDTPNSEDGLRYRQAFRLALPTGGMAEELLIDSATSLLLTAQHLSFNALDSDAPERAVIQKADPTSLRLMLPLPRLIHSIRFASSVSPQGKTTRLFRSDGDVVSEEAVASRHNPLPLSGSFPVSDSVSNLTTAAPNKVAPNTLEQQELALVRDFGASGGLPSGELDVIDGRILVRLDDGGFVALEIGSITEFNLTTGPENLRVGLRLPALGSELFFLPLSFELYQQIDAGSALRDQLSDLVQRLRDKLLDQATTPGPPPTLPDPLTLELVVESDAPCRFIISQFAIRYRLARQSFPGGEPKQVLRFANGQLSQRQLGFEVPASVILTHASLAVSGDGSAPVPGDSIAASSGQLSGLLAMAGDSGVRLDGDHCWSSPLALAEPMLIGGWDLLLSALSANARLQLEIVSDINGAPGGERLASAAALLPLPGHPQLLRFQPDEPLLLQPGSYWLTLASGDGAAVWHLQSQPGSRVLQCAAGGTVIADHAAIANWIAAAGPAAAAQRFPEITLAGQPLPLSHEADDWVYDLVPVLGGNTAAGSGLLTSELSLLASGPKPLTVYPPRLEYELQIA